jgi:hypothetical protein
VYQSANPPAWISSGRLSRADQARETRRRIVAAAAEQFVTRGYGATVLDQVAEQAGVAVQTVYFHFRNKPTPPEGGPRRGRRRRRRTGAAPGTPLGDGDPAGAGPPADH